MTGREALVRVSAALASRDREHLERALRRAAELAGGPEHPLEARAVEEALLQSYLFLGYPAALNAFALWREVRGEGVEAGAVDRSEPAAAASESADGDSAASLEAWRERGAEVCETVYGSQYGRLRENVRRLHPDLEEWMVVEGYGKVLGRPGLALVERELAIVALLALLDVPRQLHSHLRGALNAGAAPDEVDAAVETALEYAGPGAGRSAREVWDAVRRRAEAPGRAADEGA